MSVVINGSGTITGVPGAVLQVVQATTSTDVVISAATFTDTGLSASITPSSASSKILVTVSQPSYVTRNSSGASQMLTQLVRNSTTIANQSSSLGGSAATGASGNTALTGTVVYSYLDSPATTSAVTYKTQAHVAFVESGYSCTCQYFSSTSTITLMEIAG